MGKLIYNRFDGTLTTLTESVIFDTETIGYDDALLMSRYLEEEDTDALEDVAKRNGKDLEAIQRSSGYGDLNYSNSIAYSPKALRSEAEVITENELCSETPELFEMMTQVKGMSDEDLEVIGQYIVSDDDLYSGYKDNFIDGLRWFNENN